MSACRHTDLRAGSLLPREWGAIRLPDLDAGNESTLADFVNTGVRGEECELISQVGDFGWEIFEDLFLAEDIQTRERGRASERVARVTMAVVEGFLLFECPAESGEDAFRGECRGEREVAAGESLGETEKIRNHVFLFAGK